MKGNNTLPTDKKVSKQSKRKQAASTNNSEETQQKVVTAAKKLFLEYSVPGTSMRDIAKAVGIQTSMLYYYFNSKNDIIRRCASNTYNMIDNLKIYRKDLVNLSKAEILRKCVVHFIMLANEKAEDVLFLTQEYRNFQPRSGKIILVSIHEYVDFFEQLINDGIKAGEFKTEDAKLIAFNIFVLEQEWAMRRWLLKGSYDAQQYAGKQADMLIKLILVDNHRGMGSRNSNIERIVLEG